MTENWQGDSEHPSVAFYMLGALGADSEAAFERHLASCSTCQRECDEFGPMVSGLSQLPDDEVATLLAVSPATGTADGRDVPSAPGQAPVPSAPGQAANPAVPGPRRGAAGTTRPAGGMAGPPRPGDARDPTRPGRTGRRRSRRFQFVVGGFAVLLALAAGAALGMSLLPAEPTQVTPVDNSVTVEGTASSARLSVVMVERGRTTTLVATVTGLEPSVRYRLYAVTVDGHTHEVADWAGTAGAIDLTADLAVPLTDLAFFSVIRPDGTAVVAARLD